LECDGTATLDAVTTSGTGSFATLDCGGTISAGTDVRVTSDERLKSGITQIPGAIEKVKQIRGCTYTIDDKPSAGVIAQELIKVLPESVHTKEDGYYGVSYHGVIALLIEAVKELSEKVK